MNQLEKQLLSRFFQECPGATIITFIVSGSHFFDLNGPSSDKDYRAVFLPNSEQLKSGQWRRQISLNTNLKQIKNTKDDVDCTFYSLDEFLKLLSNHDFNMLELLYAPRDKILITSEIWTELVTRRTLFTPVDFSSFLGFVKKEYKRYAIDESAVKKYQSLLSFLETLPESDRLSKHWEKFTTWNNSSKIGVATTVLADKSTKRIPALKITSRFLVGTNKISTLKKDCLDMLNNFGHRKQKQAESGIEYKGLYHALRLLYEAQDLIKYGQLFFPFDPIRHEQLKKIKDGKMEKEAVVSLLSSNLAVVQEYDEKQRNNAQWFAKRQEEQKEWGCRYFYNKKQQEIMGSF